MILYHVTYLNRIPGIELRGLVPGGGGQVFSGGYAGHSRGRVFLTTFDGVSFWADRYEQLAGHHTDNPEEGWVPVVLAVDVSDYDLEVDEAGSRDAREDAFFSEEEIDSDDIVAIWDGERWVDFEDVDPDAMLDLALSHAEVEHEPGEEPIYWMDYEVFVPHEEYEEDG